jgi:hypothetical protein
LYVPVDDGLRERGPVGGGPCVSDVVDADPDGKEGVGGGEGGGQGREVLGEEGDLVDEGEDGRCVWAHKVGVCGGAARGEVVV